MNFDLSAKKKKKKKKTFDLDGAVEPEEKVGNLLVQQNIFT